MTKIIVSDPNHSVPVEIPLYSDYVENVVLAANVAQSIPVPADKTIVCFTATTLPFYVLYDDDDTITVPAATTNDGSGLDINPMWICLRDEDGNVPTHISIVAPAATIISLAFYEGGDEYSINTQKSPTVGILRAILNTRYRVWDIVGSANISADGLSVSLFLDSTTGVAFGTAIVKNKRWYFKDSTTLPSPLSTHNIYAICAGSTFGPFPVTIK
jgi:hypothetical protein